MATATAIQYRAVTSGSEQQAGTLAEFEGEEVLIVVVGCIITHEFKTAGQTSQVSLVADRFRFDPLDPNVPALMNTTAADPSYWSWSLGAHAQFINGIAAFIGYRGVEGLDHLDLASIRQ